MNELNLPTAEFAYFKTFNDVSTYLETFYRKRTRYSNKIFGPGKR